MKTIKHLFLLWGILAVLLSGCLRQYESSPTATSTAAPTRTATRTSPPTQTPTVTLTPTPLGPIGEFSLDEYIALDYERADWEERTDGMYALVHRSLADCQVMPLGGTELPGSDYTATLGGFTWTVIENVYVLTFSDNPYTRYGGGIRVLGNSACHQAAERLLAAVHARTEYAQEGKCVLAPFSNLKVGDQAEILTGTYLRNAPRWGEETRIRMLGTQDGPVKIIGGPVCGLYKNGEYIYWQVQLPNGEQGWMAEGDYQQAFLAKN